MSDVSSLSHSQDDDDLLNYTTLVTNSQVPIMQPWSFSTQIVKRLATYLTLYNEESRCKQQQQQNQYIIHICAIDVQCSYIDR